MRIHLLVLGCYELFAIIKLGRAPVANCSSVIETLSNIARFPDDWQYMAVVCLL